MARQPTIVPPKNRAMIAKKNWRLLYFSYKLADKGVMIPITKV